MAAPFTAANTSTLNGYTSGGLGGRAAFLPIGSVDVGRITRFDVRLTKSIALKERYKAMFTFDAFNLFNHRYFTSVSARAYVATAAVLNPAAGFGVGSASQGFPDGTNARRLQLGLRFIW